MHSLWSYKVQEVEYKGRRFLLAPNAEDGSWSWTETPGRHPIYTAPTEQVALLAIGALVGAAPHVTIAFTTTPGCATLGCLEPPTIPFMGRKVCAACFLDATEGAPRA